MSSADTQHQILDTAERLFACHGFAASSLRSIIAEAGVNLAAVHYHFGSKEELMRAVLERRIRPLNAERLRLLDLVAAAGSDRPDHLDRLIAALLAPPMRLSRDEAAGGPHFMKLIGRTFAEADPAIHRMFFGMFEEVVRRFVPALQQACPKLPPATLFWRCHFMIGAMAHTMCDKDAVKHYAAGVCDVNDVEGIIRELVAFVAAGLRAEAVRPVKKKGGRKS
jgi:AcrR family transcriptional regulator